MYILVTYGDVTQEEAICLLTLDGEIFLLVQANKIQTNNVDAEPQLMAKAITAFRSNATKRMQKRQEELESWMFPCIMMRGTYPIFYRVTITKALV